MRNWLSFIIFILKFCWLIALMYLFIKYLIANVPYGSVEINIAEISALVCLFSMYFWFVWIYKIYTYDNHIFKMHVFLIWIWIKCDDKTIKRTTRFDRHRKLSYEGYEISWRNGFSEFQLTGVTMFINETKLNEIGALQKIRRES